MVQRRGVSIAHVARDLSVNQTQSVKTDTKWPAPKFQQNRPVAESPIVTQDLVTLAQGLPNAGQARS